MFCLAGTVSRTGKERGNAVVRECPRASASTLYMNVVPALSLPRAYQTRFSPLARIVYLCRRYQLFPMTLMTGEEQRRPPLEAKEAAPRPPRVAQSGELSLPIVIACYSFV